MWSWEIGCLRSRNEPLLCHAATSTGFYERAAWMSHLTIATEMSAVRSPGFSRSLMPRLTYAECDILLIE